MFRLGSNLVPTGPKLVEWRLSISQYMRTHGSNRMELKQKNGNLDKTMWDHPPSQPHMPGFAGAHPLGTVNLYELAEGRLQVRNECTSTFGLLLIDYNLDAKPSRYSDRSSTTVLPRQT
jgi:hypothetical protein